jgi:putative pyridoxal-dependent aspartate 1-decarboxylase
MNKIQKSNIEEVFELSMAQKGMLFHYMKDAVENLFNVQLVIQIDGPLDLNLIRQSICDVQSNNEVLRSVFNWEIAAKPLQIILKETPVEISFQDLSEKRNDELLALNNLYFEEDRQRRFDLNKSAIRFGIIKLSVNSYLMHITHHHILYDGWSTGILLKELFSAYDALMLKSRPTLNGKPGYKEIQRAIKPKLADEFDKQYWLNYLKDYELANLSSVYSCKNENERLKTISTVESGLNLELFSAQHKVTKAAVIYAAYGILLQKYLYTSDVVFGTAVSYREGSMRSAENVIGNFINTIPFRLNENENLSFLETVMGVHRNLIDRNTYNYTSYPDIKQMMGLHPNESLFDSVIAIENYPLDKKIQNEVRDYQVKLHSVYENVGLPLHIAVFFEEGLKIDFTYDTRYITDGTIIALSIHLPMIIGSILENPSKTIRSINLISEEERQKLLHDFNNTEVIYPKDKTIIDLFEEQVEKTPDQCALFNSSVSITYVELNRSVNQLAYFLKGNGVEKGNVVGILMDRSLDFVISVLAVLKVGALYLPIDSSYPDERVNYMLEDSKAVMVLTKTEIFAGKQIKRLCRIFCYDRLQMELENLIDLNIEGHKVEHINVIYTSGSTGVPKGVIGSYEGLLNRLFWGWETYPIKGNEVFCLKTNIGFVDHMVELFSPLLSGVPLRIVSQEELLDVPAMYALLIREKITRITVVPSYLMELISQKREEKLQEHSLKYVFCSGEYLPFQLAKDFYSEFSEVLLVNIYGSTEVSADATYYHVERDYVEDVLKYFKKYTDVQSNLFSNQSQDDSLDYNSITFPGVEVKELAKNFQRSRIPDYPTNIEKYFSDFQKNVLPYSVNTASPRFIGHMTSVLPDYVHDISKLISQLNQNLVKIETSKSLTFIEREAIAMLHRIFFSFSETFYQDHIQKLNSNLGVITSGGSTANMSALLSARNKLLYGKPDKSLDSQSIYQVLRATGYSDLVVIGSSLMHYSFHKAVSLLGLGTNNILYVRNDTDRKVDVVDLQRKIDYCKEQKLLIIAIIGIAGSTETGSIDPLWEMGKIARQNEIHFHVDAAWGGLLKFSDQYSKLLDGIELADSITFCGHKQLFLPQGISVCLFKNPHQVNYNSSVANYQAKADSYDFGRVTLEGSKSGLSLCLHASLTILGKKGYGLLLDKGIKLSNTFAGMIRGTSGLELISVNINIVNYRYIPIKYRGKTQYNMSSYENEIVNEVNTSIQEAQFLKGRSFVSKTKLRRNDNEHIVVFRVVLSNPLTTHQDLEYVVKDQLLIIEELFGEKNSLKFVAIRDAEIPSSSEGEGNRKIPIGKPISNTKILILDANNELQPIGVPGELCVSGAGIAKGYLNSEFLTGERFIMNPFQKGSWLYKTGDLAKWLPDGNIEFLGRLDDQVKIRGYRIELAEIRDQIMAYKGIKDAVVIVNEKKKELVGYYVSAEKISSSELRRHLLEYLPEYMVPALYVYMERLPLNASGKIDRKKLPTPEFTAGENYIAPSTEIEEELVKIWSGLLKVDKENISTNRSFFELGGNSLNLISLQKEIEKKLKVDMSIADFFRHTTIQAIVKYINGDIISQDDLKKEIEVEVSEMDDLVDNINNEEL